MNCAVCGKEIVGEYLSSNVGFDLKPSSVIVCSEKCAGDASGLFKFDGNAVQQWSRITGYYQNTGGWNSGKISELKDRNRVNI